MMMMMMIMILLKMMMIMILLMLMLMMILLMMMMTTMTKMTAARMMILNYLLLHVYSPMNMLDHVCDNFGYAMAFGSVTSHCFQLFTGASFAEGPTWSKSKNNTLAGHTLQ